MRYTSAFVFLVFLTAMSAPSLCRAEGKTYQRDDLHFSFTLPEGWEAMPKSEVEATSAAASRFSAQLINYSAGYRKFGQKTPYLLIQPHDQTDSLEKIAEALDSTKTREAIQQFKGGPLKNPGFGKPEIDQKRKVVIVDMEMEVGGAGRLQALMAIFPGSTKSVQINMYSKTDEFKKLSLTFNAVVNSFRYDAGHGYGEDAFGTFMEGFADPFRNGVNGVVGALIGGAVAGIGVLLWVMFQAMRKVPTPDGQDWTSINPNDRPGVV